MKKYILAVLIGFCWGIIGNSFTAFAEQGTFNKVTCCSPKLRKDCPDPNNKCCGSDCKDGDENTKEICCEEKGGTPYISRGGGKQMTACCVGARNIGGSISQICCENMQGGTFKNGICCGSWGTAIKSDAALPMCKKK